jgi:hypothetical protein
MKRVILIAGILSLALTATALPGPLQQRIKVNPEGGNVSASGTTILFLTYGPLLSTHVSAEGCFCGEIMSAAPDLGSKCNPATIFGCLPARHDFSTRSGTGGFTDVMSIPPSVVRRAYQAAQEGANSSFFYVRRFINTAGGPDEYVPCLARLSGGGASTPFSLTDVKLLFAVDKPILLLQPGEKIPAVKAEITYNGTGRLKGRWEIVEPGDEPPSVRDLLTEASLPIEERGTQRRYTAVGTFNHFLPPAGKFTLPGPDPARLPNNLKGQYLILLRIESADDKEGDSDLSAVGAGPGVIHTGAVAGFPLPALRYIIGGGFDSQLVGKLSLLLPVEDGIRQPDKPVDFSWSELAQAAFYRLELTDAQGKAVISAIVAPGVGTYRAPSWLKDKTGDGNLRWRVVALDQSGAAIAETPWRTLRLVPASK